MGGSLFRVAQDLAGGLNRKCVLHIYEAVKPSKHLGHPDLARLGQIFNIFPPTSNQLQKLEVFIHEKRPTKNMLCQMDFYGLLICYSMTVKLSMGKNSA